MVAFDRAQTTTKVRHKCAPVAEMERLLRYVATLS